MKKTAKIYYTSDTHGYLFGTDFIGKEEKPMGVLNCIREFQKDENTLILDGGDTLQGAPLTKYLWENQGSPKALAQAFNKGKYDYITLGNHDFNYDYSGIEGYLETLEAQCLLANVKDTKGSLPIKPYVIHTLGNGLKIGIVGIVTDYIKVWENPEHLKNLEVEEAFLAAQLGLEAIKHKCDFTVCLYHGGYECNLENGETLIKGTENVGYRICKELDYDLLLSAHQHLEVTGRKLFGTYTLQLPPNALKYAVLEMSIKEGKKEIHSYLQAPKASRLQELEPKEKRLRGLVEEWLDQKIGCFTEEVLPLHKLDLALTGSRIADFCNQLQLEYTKADFSCTSLGNQLLALNTEVTIRDIMAICPFPNSIVVLEVNEEILRQALERCAQYYHLEEGQVKISEQFLVPKVEHYNYDFFAGFSYTFDISKPVGQRVSRLSLNGRPLGNQTYTLAMSNYRATGTGGYEFYRACELVEECSVDIQKLAIDYVQSHPNVQIMPKTDFVVTY